MNIHSVNYSEANRKQLDTVLSAIMILLAVAIISGCAVGPRGAEHRRDDGGSGNRTDGDRRTGDGVVGVGGEPSWEVSGGCRDPYYKTQVRSPGQMRVVAYNKEGTRRCIDGPVEDCAGCVQGYFHECADGRWQPISNQSFCTIEPPRGPDESTQKYVDELRSKRRSCGFPADHVDLMYRRGSAIAQQGGSRRAMIALSTVPYENKVADTVMSGHAADLSAEYCILKFLGANDSLLSGILRIPKDAPELIHKDQPNYPTQAASRGIVGNVILELTVTDTGSTSSVRILQSPDPLLSDAATRAVQSWHYKPAKDALGNPVAADVTVEIEFGRN